MVDGCISSKASKVRPARYSRAMAIDPTDSVRELLEQAAAPLSTDQMAETLKDAHGRHEVEEALDFWRREPHSVFKDADGNWSWVGPPA